MKNKSKNIIFMLLIFILAMFLCTSYSFADISDDAESFIEAGGGGASAGDTEAMKSAIVDISGLLTGIGIIVTVVVAAILGIQFMMGTVEEQAKIKESIIPYVCGCAVIFGAAGIWKLVVNLLNRAL